MELGVSRFVPCKTEYSNFEKLNYKNLEFNAIEASQQCERLDVPKIEKIINFKSLLDGFPSDRALVFVMNLIQAFPRFMKKSNLRFQIIQNGQL